MHLLILVMCTSRYYPCIRERKNREGDRWRQEKHANARSPINQKELAKEEHGIQRGGIFRGNKPHCRQANVPPTDQTQERWIWRLRMGVFSWYARAPVLSPASGLTRIDYVHRSVWLQYTLECCLLQMCVPEGYAGTWDDYQRSVRCPFLVSETRATRHLGDRGGAAHPVVFRPFSVASTEHIHFPAALLPPLAHQQHTH